MPNNEFGDFQTPEPLAASLLATVPARNWARVLEPTAGTGAFLAAARKAFPHTELLGIEMQAAHVERARRIAPILHADLFTLDLADLPWRGPAGPTLVIGNPPWVTNSQLSVFDSENRPPRNNFRNDRGIDAITGSANFDVAEAVWLHLLGALTDTETTVALLCKTQVARNVFRHCARTGLPIESAEIRRIDARHWFGVSVDACWFTVTLRDPARVPSTGDYRAAVYPDLAATTPEHVLGVADGRLIRDIDSYSTFAELDGRCPVAWRQGVKHDAAAVMELTTVDGRPVAATGEPVDIEPDYLFPLFKCTDVYHGRTHHSTRWMVVPQRHPGDDTAMLADDAPHLWRYLTRHAVALDGRRSTIYRNRPRFGIFGVGPYTFAPYKIAISGLHKQPRFQLFGPVAGRSAVFDDATYLLPFDDPAECAVVHALLCADETRALLAAISFPDSKRPITKAVLQRIDLAAVLRRIDRRQVVAHATTQLERLGGSGDPAAAADTLTAQWGISSIALDRSTGG